MRQLRRGFLPATVIVASTIILHLFSMQVALAQEEKAPEEYKLETMTVTAEKREENIQEVPVSITVLSEIEIEDAGIVDTEDLIYQIPNLHMTKTGSHGGGSYFGIRGITPHSMSITPTVGFYVDDVYYPGGIDIGLLDAERIEVLRGPQGTLYGRNTSGGVINIVTKKPGNLWEAKASAGYGNYNSQSYNAAIGGPLVQDKLFFRVTGSYFLSDGYFDNKFTGHDDADDLDDLSGRALLRWTPTDTWDITLSAESQQYQDGYACFAPIDEVRNNPHDVNLDYEGSVDHDDDVQSLRMVHTGEWFTLTAITGFRNWESDEKMDMDGSPADSMRGYFTNERETLSQEIRLSSAKESAPLKWLVGGYFFDETFNTDYTLDFRQGFPPVIPPFKNIIEGELDTESYAFFGQGTYTFFDKLGLTAGLRYDYQTKDFKFHEHYDQDLSMFGMLPQKADADEDFDEWLPKFALDYRFTPDLMTYASLAKGYKSGGFNTYSSSAGIPYDPEYTWNYEIGIKSAWLDKRLIVNLAGFYVDWQDQQVFQSIGHMEMAVKNAAESTSKGFEIEVMARPASQGKRTWKKCNLVK